MEFQNPNDNEFHGFGNFALEIFVKVSKFWKFCFGNCCKSFEIFLKEFVRTLPSTWVHMNITPVPPMVRTCFGKLWKFVMPFSKTWKVLDKGGLSIRLWRSF